jgi:hypothetical protein
VRVAKGDVKCLHIQHGGKSGGVFPMNIIIANKNFSSSKFIQSCSRLDYPNLDNMIITANNLISISKVAS